MATMQNNKGFLHRDDGRVILHFVSGPLKFSSNFYSFLFPLYMQFRLGCAFPSSPTVRHCSVSLFKKSNINQSKICTIPCLIQRALVYHAACSLFLPPPTPRHSAVYHQLTVDPKRTPNQKKKIKNKNKKYINK
ncbi:DNA polymerase iota [Histoplasma ohiense]|nr:DNA polymerase iota [Histoplasma ohiense (nom. inval.)]